MPSTDATNLREMLLDIVVLPGSPAVEYTDRRSRIKRERIMAVILHVQKYSAIIFDEEVSVLQ